MNWFFCSINHHEPILVRKDNDKIACCEHCKVQMQYTDGRWVKGIEPFIKNLYKK
jgi:hypothetical protein